MSTSPPRRKFLPEPVETSTRSSKRPHHENADHVSQVRFETKHFDPQTPISNEPLPGTTKPRRFLPQPVEESTRTSRKPQAKHIEDEGGPAPVRKAGVGEETPPTAGTPRSADEKPEPSSRRFAPEPVETSVKSSRRRFAPEPVETSTKRSRDKRAQQEAVSSSPPARRRFAPEPVETTSVRRRRRKSTEEDNEQPSSPAVEEEPLSASGRTSTGGRRFTPELLETAKGSYRRSQVSPKTSPSHSKVSSPPGSTSSEAADTISDLEESRFSAASLAKRHHHENHRQHSFMIPNLPMIESDESEEDSEPPSLSDSPYDSSASSDRRQSSRSRKGEDSYTDYVLRLAARTAEKQLQDQAMAAYINERPHEPVDHFAIDNDSDEDVPVHIGKLSTEKGIDVRTFRRDSAGEFQWELENMRRHHEQLELAKRELKEHTAGQSRFSAAALMARQHGIGMKKKTTKSRKGGKDGGDEEDNEMSRMRTAASPPYAGGDLLFPMTISPKMTRCDVDQLPRPRTADSDDGQERTQGDPELWSAKANVSNANGAGLWMGLCQKGSNDLTRPATPTRSGIQTPAFDMRNPLETGAPGRRTPGRQTPGRGGGPRAWLVTGWLPLTSTSRDGKSDDDPFTASIDKKLNLEQQIEEEFPNRVVTQIYNYLSLGYPSLAHPFDEELSKISRISVEDLRKDDEGTDAKGYVGVPEGDGVDDRFVEQGRCRRWEALRLYVREWARQSVEFKEDAANRRFGGAEYGSGARVRRGSWAH